ncbi:hypothetical protein GCM10010116_06530 [Microbispora rosea subsp. aerata]|nr:hypothetical protein GCM10010116_06530 [Microbispora rosea subsp. aerata]GLJ83739.1 hypothetical protein GCM10017588_24670 [Microbispora rosea subsp. aerata]
MINKDLDDRILICANDALNLPRCKPRIIVPPPGKASRLRFRRRIEFRRYISEESRGEFSPEKTTGVSARPRGGLPARTGTP